MALKNLAAWNGNVAIAACGAACGASDKPAEEPKPAPEPEPAGELPPAEIWSAQPASAPEPVQTPVETVIVPESHSYAEPVQVLPLEEPEQACDETPADDSGRSEA